MREQTPGNPSASPVRPTPLRRSRPTPVSADLRKRYLAVGLIVGAAWAWHRGPLWLHVVSLVTVVVVVIPVTQLVRTRLGSSGKGRCDQAVAAAWAGVSVRKPPDWCCQSFA